MLRYNALGYTPELETDRLILRKLTMHDAEDIYAYSKDPEVARHGASGRTSIDRRIARVFAVYDSPLSNYRAG